MLPLWGSCREATEGASWHGFSSSRGRPLSVWKGSRSAGRRPECLSSNRFDEARTLRATVIRKAGARGPFPPFTPPG
ncbi:hypothetical protein SAMN02799626_04440, partial [Caulobacter sp. UNC279MFTsu5.1]